MPRRRMSKNELREAKRSVRRLLEGIAADVAALPAPVVRELLPVLVQAQRETEQALQRWLARGPEAAERFTAHHYRQVLIQLRTARVGAQAVVLNKPAWVIRIRDALRDALRKSTQRSGALATQHLISEVATFDQIFRSSLAPIPIEQAAIIAKGDKMLIPRFQRSAQRYSGAIWDDMRRQLAISLARNESVERMLARLARLGGPRTPDAPAGLFRRYRHWGERVVRTEAINAYNVQHMVGINEANALDPEIKKRWDATLDSRLCVICQSLHGEIVEVGEMFPGGFDKPPAHPNCRCAVVAWHESWGEDIVPKKPLTPQNAQE